MNYQNKLETDQKQILFYRWLCLALVATVGVQEILSSIDKGPYFVKENDSFFTVSRSEPWKLTVERVRNFLNLYLKGRMEWSKEDFESKRSLLSEISSEAVQSKLKDSLVTFEAMAKSQDMRSFYVVEGYRVSNERRIIEATVSRVIRIGTTGVVTPIRVIICYDESAITENNPYGLKVISLDESEIKSGSDPKAAGGAASS